MGLFVMNILRALTLISITITSTKCIQIKGSLPFLLTDIIESYVKPYLNTIQSNDSPVFRSTKNEIYEKIDKKVEELKPYLQDNDSLQDTNEETQIIEYIPKTNNQISSDDKDDKKSLRGTGSKKDKGKSKTRYEIKYRSLRKKIVKALETETVSAKTKKLVTQFIDKLIEDSNTTECMWKNKDNPLITFRNNMKSENITMDEWNSLKSIYTDTENEDSVLKQQTLKTFEQFHKFFTKLVNESIKANNRYKISCHLVDLNNDTSKLATRQTPKCKKFRVCSTELTDFFKDFYNSLNETTVSVFKNYAAMYVNDASNGTDTERVVEIVSKLGDSVEGKVRKLYSKSLDSFKLDEKKDQETNIKLIKEFVRTIVSTLINKLKKQLEDDLLSQKDNLLNAVEKDVRINLNVDLGNMKRDVLTGVCKLFSTCNGKVVSGRRSGGDSNSIHIELDVLMDDELHRDINKANQFLKKFRRAEIMLREGMTNKVTRTTLDDLATAKARTSLDNDLTAEKTLSPNFRALLARYIKHLML